jgi:uncharacterized protein (TIGR04255 family)
MTQTVTQSKITPLFNPLLLEAIFELRWELQADQQSGRYRDPAYPMMYGRIYEHLKESFPLIEDLPTVQVHPEASPYAVRHRLRKERDSLPIVQIGPGIVTINDMKGFSWSKFKSLALQLIELVDSLYPKAVMPLNFIGAELRYINGLPHPLGNPLLFLAEKLQIKIEPPKDVLKEQTAPKHVGLNLAYPLSLPVGNLLLSVNMGQMESQPAFIIQSVVQSGGEVVPQNKDELDRWLTRSHEVAERSFESLCKGVNR